MNLFSCFYKNMKMGNSTNKKRIKQEVNREAKQGIKFSRDYTQEELIMMRKKINSCVCAKKCEHENIFNGLTHFNKTTYQNIAEHQCYSVKINSYTQYDSHDQVIRTLIESCECERKTKILLLKPTVYTRDYCTTVRSTIYKRNKFYTSLTLTLEDVYCDFQQDCNNNYIKLKFSQADCDIINHDCYIEYPVLQEQCVLCSLKTLQYYNVDGSIVCNSCTSRLIKSASSLQPPEYKEYKEDIDETLVIDSQPFVYTNMYTNIEPSAPYLESEGTFSVNSKIEKIVVLS